MAYTNEKGLSGNDTTNPSGVKMSAQEIMSDDLLWNLNIYINILLCGSVAITGSVSNVINIIIFYQLGLKDSMSVCLFALAVTDALQSFLVLISRTFPIWSTFFSTEAVDPMAVSYVGFDWVADGFFLSSGWITTVLSMERCVCVIFPFKVKQIFTRNRAIVAIVVIYIVTSAIYFPIYATHWVGWINEEIQTANGTSLRRRSVVVFSEDRLIIEYYVEILSVTVIPIPSLVLMLGSVLWMIYGLKISSEIRISMTTKNTELDGAKQDSAMTNKTRRLVKVVLFLAIIFIICSFPRLYATFVALVHTQVDEHGIDRNLHIFMWQVARCAAVLNASVNIFLYLKINSSYRAKFRELFKMTLR